MARNSRPKIVMKRLLIVQLVASLCACGDSTAPDQPVPGDESLADRLGTLRAAHDLPSLGAMLIQGDQIVEMAAIGMRAVGSGDQVTTEDRWHLGSLTKAMTATLAGILVERGVVVWSTTIGLES